METQERACSSTVGPKTAPQRRLHFNSSSKAEAQAMCQARDQAVVTAGLRAQSEKGCGLSVGLWAFRRVGEGRAGGGVNKKGRPGHKQSKAHMSNCKRISKVRYQCQDTG
jgi:hypothetical protein